VSDESKGFFVSIGGFTLAVGLACWFLVLDQTDQTLPALTLGIAFLYLAEVWVFRRLTYPPVPRAAMVAADAAKGAEQANDKAPTAKTKGVEKWDNLPSVPVPSIGDVRNSVIAFARQHGFQPYEAERGYALLDAQGNWYRAAVV
jgi:hypothetical protein